MSWAVSFFFFGAAPSSSISRNAHVHSDITSHQLVEGSNHFNFPFRAIFESQQAPWVKVALETEVEIDEDLLGREPLSKGGTLFLGSAELSIPVLEDVGAML